MGDLWIGRLGVAGLVISAIAAAIGGTYLAAQGKEIPPFLAGLGNAAVSTVGTVVIALTMRGDKNGQQPR